MSTSPGITFYFNDREALKLLSETERCQFYDAILDYAQFGVIPEFDSEKSAVAWTFIKPHIDYDIKRYEEKCIKSEYANYCKDQKKKDLEPVAFEYWLRTVPDGSGRFQNINIK